MFAVVINGDSQHLHHHVLKIIAIGNQSFIRVFPGSSKLVRLLILTSSMTNQYPLLVKFRVKKQAIKLPIVPLEEMAFQQHHSNR